MTIDRCPVAHGTDFTDPDLIQAGVPLPEFAYLRQTEPMYWNAQTVENSSYDDGGFWMATRHEDVKAISSARAVIRSAALSRMLERSPAVMFGQGPVSKARRAAAMARSVSTFVAT